MPPDLAAVDRQLSGRAGNVEGQPPARLDALEHELGDRPTALHPRVEAWSMASAQSSEAGSVESLASVDEMRGRSSF